MGDRGKSNNLHTDGGEQSQVLDVTHMENFEMVNDYFNVSV